MGQACCVPHKHMSRRTAKLKAEACSAAAISGDCVHSQSQVAASTSSEIPSLTETQSNLLHSGRISELREILAVSSSPVRRLREPREWLQQKKHRLTGHKQNKKAQLPEKFTSSRDKHKHNHSQKHKVKVARNEASFADNNEPITLLEATLLEEIPLREAAGQSVLAATPPGAAHTMHLRELLHKQPTMAERQRNPQSEPDNNLDQPPSELLSPIPRRPANFLQFSFFNHTSDTSTCSSKRSSKGSNDDKDCTVSPEKNSTSSADTIIARKTSRDRDNDRADAGSVRFSISSMSPDIFYMAPTSPKLEPAAPFRAPTLLLTPASPPAFPMQTTPSLSATSNPNILDVKVPTWPTQPKCRWARAASSPSILRSKAQQPSNGPENSRNITWNEPTPFCFGRQSESQPY